jgi:hypothetical protein
MSNLIGTGADQVPMNGMLGSLAFRDSVIPVVETKSAAYTVNSNDNGKILVVSGTTTITLPLAAGLTQFIIGIKAITGATVTVARSGSDTIENVGGNKSMTANTGLWFYPSGSAAWETL